MSFGSRRVSRKDAKTQRKKDVKGWNDIILQGGGNISRHPPE